MAKFKNGDRVRRINHDNNNTVCVGTEWTVAGVDRGWLTLKETKESGGNEDNFVLVSSAEPKPNLKATMYVPRKDVEELVRTYLEKRLGIKSASVNFAFPFGPELAVEVGVKSVA